MHNLPASAARGFALLLVLMYEALAACAVLNSGLLCAITYSANTAAQKVMHGSTS